MKKRGNFLSIERLSAELKNGEAFLIASPENRRYLTGFDSSDGFLFITSSRAAFFTDSRYIEAASARVGGCDEIILLKSFKTQLPEYAERNGISRIYTEASRLSVSQFAELSRAFSCEVIAEKADEEINLMRRCKREFEKQRIIKAQGIAEKAFDHILGFIHEGVSEKEIALELDYFMLRNGADGLSFETIAVSGRNSSMPHGVPSEKKIEKGDFITMDYGAIVDGYHSDMTRTVALGEISSKQAKVYETVLQAQLSALDVLAPRVSCKDADLAARSIIEKAGYGDCFGHGTGHGVGIDIHEAPTVSFRSNQLLEAGDVVTVEPGIYICGEFGVRIEDMAFITDKSYINLTKSNKSLIIL